MLTPEQNGLHVPVDGTFDRIAQMAAQVFGAQIATVSIIGDGRVWFAAAEGLGGMNEAPIESELIAAIQRESGPFVVDDVTSDPRTMRHPVVCGDFGVRFYVAAPIMSMTGQALGAVEVMDSKRRRRVSDAQLGMLRDLAATVAQLLQMRLSALMMLRSERLSRVAESDRRDVAEQLAAQLSQAQTAERDRGRPEWCQLGGSLACGQRAELKMADTWGDSAWGCWTHAEEALVQVPSVFLANESPVGLAAYRGRVSRN